MEPSVESFMQVYAHRYMNYEVDAIVGLCRVPFVAVRDGVAHDLPDEGAVRAHFAVVMDAYRSTSATDAQIRDMVVHPQGHSACTVTVRWHVLAADRALLKDFETTYHLLVNQQNWEILSYVNHH